MAEPTYDVSIRVRLGDAGWIEMTLKDGSRKQAQAVLDFHAAHFSGRTTVPKLEPSSTDSTSLGAASTTRNPPPGEQGDTE